MAALLSALALVGIEEVLVETETLRMLLGHVRVAWLRRRLVLAMSRLAGVDASVKAAAQRLHQHFVHFLLSVEGLPLSEARKRAAALRVALLDEGD